MARQYVSSDGGLINETGSRQYVSSDGGIVNETVAAGGDIALTIAWTESADVFAMSGSVVASGVSVAAAWTEGADVTVIAGSVAAAGGVITTPTLKNNTGTILASETGVVVNVYDATTGALVVRKTGLTSSAGGVVTVTDVLIIPATSYAYEVVLTANGRRLPVGLAT